MGHERLTEKTKDCFGYRLKDGSDAEIGFFKDYDAFYSHMMTVKALGEYEDLEEQGLLLRLPCKEGDTIYYILGIPGKTPCVIERAEFELSDIWKIGKSVFLTRSEAEEKMKELEGK